MNQKWLRHQARLARDENHLKRPALPRSRVASLQKRAFLDEWEVEEHIMVPEDYRHISRLSSDLQHIGLDSRISIDDGCSLHDQDVLYQHDPIQRDSEAEVSAPFSQTSSNPAQVTRSQDLMYLANHPYFKTLPLQASLDKHSTSCQYTPFPATQPFRCPGPPTLHLLLRHSSVVRIQLVLHTHQPHGLR